MSLISEIQIEQQEQWNQLVRSFSDYEPHYLNEYAKAFMNENEKNGIPVLLYYENGEERAIYEVFKRDIAKDEKFSHLLEPGKYFDLISPYGYGGFWGNITDYNKLNEVYNSYCSENQYICEFIRFELFGEYSKNYDGDVKLRFHNVVRSLDKSIDDIWMSFKSKVRRNVRRAENNGVEFVVDLNGEKLQDFLEIYYSTMDLNNADDEYYFSKSFFKTLNQLRDNIAYFHAVYEGKVISTEVILIGAENCYFYLGGSNREYSHLRPNDFLKYHIIKWAHDKGLKNYILGGGYGDDDNLFQYKVGYAPDGIVDFYIGKKIFDQKSYDYLVELRAKTNSECKSSVYFPRYRA